MALYCIGRTRPSDTTTFATLDANEAADASEKGKAIRHQSAMLLNQHAQIDNPDHKILLSGAIEGPLLGTWADALQGIATADYDRFGRTFWEMPCPFRVGYGSRVL